MRIKKSVQIRVFALANPYYPRIISRKVTPKCYWSNEATKLLLISQLIQQMRLLRSPQRQTKNPFKPVQIRVIRAPFQHNTKQPQSLRKLTITYYIVIIIVITSIY